jgi:tetratricopeptide (TPR) repeat protein
LAETLRATELNPSFALGHYARGIALMASGRPHDGIVSIARAIRLSTNDPWLPWWYSGMGICHYMARDYPKALEYTTLAIQGAPHLPVALGNHAAVLGQLGRKDEAAAVLQRFVEVSPGFTAERARRALPQRDDADFEHYLEGLRKAGWTG